MRQIRFLMVLILAWSCLPGQLAAQGRDGDAGQFVILSAKYGTEHRNVDVTNRLKELARRDRQFRVNHESMNADPAEGRAKVLRVFARGPNGRERMFEFPDGSVFDGSQFRSWGRGDWGDDRWNGGWNGSANNDAGQYVILSAQYGTERRHVDVTQQLRDAARQDQLFRMGNNTFGVDPDPGVVKTLRIFARGPNGQEQMLEYREGSVIDGSQFRGWGSGDWGSGGWSGNWNGGDAGQFVILSAQYGTERSHVDVTARLKELARADMQFPMGNRTFGVDPDPGVVKTLRIYARGPNGGERMFEYREGSVVDGSQFRSWGRGDWGSGGWSGNWNGGDAGQFVILSAQYGTERRHVDVTARLKELARADMQFRMGNSTFGVDPDPGVVKTLRIYARGPNGGERMFEYREGSVVDGSQFRGWGRGEWASDRDRWSGRW